MATLVYAYRESLAVVAPLLPAPDPHSYDLCNDHARRLTAPRGWTILRTSLDTAQPSSWDNVMEMAEAERPRPVTALSGRRPLSPRHGLVRYRY